jgi:putative peptidoglycan lipid II flippase
VASVAVIAGLTIVTRLAGFARTLDFAWVVGSTDLGDTYQTANIVPNIVFEIFAGGALSVFVVPLLAGAVAAGDRRQVAATASAVLTWTLVLLVPLAVAVAVFAEPIMTLLGGGMGAPGLAVGARMLRVFAWQIPLYGVGVVLTGILHAHQRFGWPVIAPLLSSVTVIGVYTTFAAVNAAALSRPAASLDSLGAGLAQLSPAGEAVLSIGTTVGVAVLTLCLAIPVYGLGVRLRPTFAVTAMLRRRAAGVGAAAVVAVAAQQLGMAYLIRLANGGPDGSLVLFSLAQTVFLLPWAVFAVPLATSSFPRLAAASAAGDERGFDARLARATRAVLLAAGLGVGLLVATAVPLGRFLSGVTATHPPAGTLTFAILAFAPGLLGYGLFALFVRALHACGDARGATIGAVAGWSVTVLAGVALAGGFGPAHRVVALAAASSVGLTALGVALLAVVVRRRGAAAVAGGVRTLLVSLGGAGVAGAVGWAVGASGDSLAVMVLTSGIGGPVFGGMVAAVTAVVAFMGVVMVSDRAVARAVVGRLPFRPGLVRAGTGVEERP